MNQKSYRTVKGLDISAYAMLRNEIVVFCGSFLGVVIIETNHIVPTERVIESIKLRTKPVYRCGFCKKGSDDLRRCSQCKSIYYCDEDHQLRDWKESHAQNCRKNIETPPMSPSLIEDVNYNTNQTANTHEEDDEIEEVNNSVSLLCPLMIDRIVTPAKGINCRHPHCFDLQTFISLAEQSYNWQCPICLRPLPESEVRVDHRMAAILQRAPEDVEQIRFLPDGHVEMVNDLQTKLENESGSEDEEDQLQKKKRKLNPETQPETSSLPPNSSKLYSEFFLSSNICFYSRSSNLNTR